MPEQQLRRRVLGEAEVGRDLVARAILEIGTEDHAALAVRQRTDRAAQAPAQRGPLDAREQASMIRRDIFGHRVVVASAAGDAAVPHFADGASQPAGIVLACDGDGSAIRASLRLPWDAGRRPSTVAWMRGSRRGPAAT